MNPFIVLRSALAAFYIGAVIVQLFAPSLSTVFALFFAAVMTALACYYDFKEDLTDEY